MNEPLNYIILSNMQNKSSQHKKTAERCMITKQLVMFRELEWNYCALHALKFYSLTRNYWKRKRFSKKKVSYLTKIKHGISWLLWFEIIVPVVTSNVIFGTRYYRVRKSEIFSWNPPMEILPMDLTWMITMDHATKPVQCVDWELQ